MGMFEKGQISALKLGILLKQYKPYKSVSLSDSICFFCHIRHSLKDTKIPDALIFPSPFFGGGGDGAVQWGVFSSSFTAQDASPTQCCFYITSVGNITECFFKPHCSWTFHIKIGQQRVEKHSYRRLWKWVTNLLKQKNTQKSYKSHSKFSSNDWYNTLIKALLCDMTFSSYMNSFWFNRLFFAFKYST